MQKKQMIGCGLAVALWGVAGSGMAAEDLEGRYSSMLTALQTSLQAALPELDAAKQAEFSQARAAEEAAKERLQAAQENVAKIKKAQGLVGHAKNHWIAKADRGIAQVKKDLEAAETEEERAAARASLEKWQENRQAGVDALKERQAQLDEVKKHEPQYRQELAAAEAALEAAQARTLEAVAQLGVADLLASDKLDPKLVKYVVLLEATPEGLADFAGQGKEQAALVEDLLSDAGLMQQMLVADGAAGGEYGRAMEIYNNIQSTSANARDGVLQRLALAVSLEHAEPISQRSAKALTDAPANIDPLNRYLHYEKAYLGGELDPGFAGLSVWDYRMVVNGHEPDVTLAWGREMLRNYRPDHITTDDYRWRYVAAVRTEIRYGSQDNKYDKPELQFFQNILMNGGVCGRRAFFGRFILRAFGVPTTARPQPGHAALAHWTPDGWVVVLGGGWGSGRTKTRYNKDLDFLANTQAREARQRFLEVKRAQWIGDVMGEDRVFGFRSGDPDFWYAVSLYWQRAIIEELDAKTLAAVGEELGEANESDVEYAIETTTVSEEDLQITVQADGTITIPAVATSEPTESTGKIIFMDSVLGGKQMHYSRNGKPQDFVYTFEAPRAGTYALSARVVTPSWKQHLLVSANGSEPVDIALPFTVGMWEVTEPVKVELGKGRNSLRFSHTSEGYAKGVTIKDFTLRQME